MSADFDYLAAAELRGMVARKEVSPVELARRALEKAEATQSSLNAFFVIMMDEALAAAKTAEEAVMKGAPLGLLHGIPFCQRRSDSRPAGQRDFRPVTVPAGDR
jgi:aspartyl-tRNA(Asn)/glutamyl-tRNA(Gln) amidotransferase subunit A